jgi:23S rRNA (cytidine1920-2'-O)/16S rRNA (cytidine1409-2'-O)-methyltransferase
MMEKLRLDVLLLERGLCPSREKARSTILAGNVLVDGIREDKPGTTFPVGCDIEIKQPACPYVSRGGLKLKKGIDTFGIDLTGKDAMDVGASTGGFTHCMLEHGVDRVIAIDVGYGQLAWELRNDSRVFCMERTNIRYVTPKDLSFVPQFVTVDVSFISLKKVIPNVLTLVQTEAEFLCLIKPQFEAGRSKVGKKGVVRERETHQEVILDLVNFFREQKLEIEGISFSPVKGPEGNIEFLIYCNTYRRCDINIDNEYIKGVLDEAYKEL